jgi:hypothetical protein
VPPKPKEACTACTPLKKSAGERVACAYRQSTAGEDAKACSHVGNVWRYTSAVHQVLYVPPRPPLSRDRCAVSHLGERASLGGSMCVPPVARPWRKWICALHLACRARRRAGKKIADCVHGPRQARVWRRWVWLALATEHRGLHRRSSVEERVVSPPWSGAVTNVDLD